MPPASTILSVGQLNQLTRNAVDIGWSDHEVLWDCLLSTVRHPSVSDKHMTAACNAICFVIRTSSRSKLEHVRDFAYSSKSWTQTFEAARCAFASGKNKPALQVMDTLAYLTKTHPDRHAVSENVSAAAAEMVKLIYVQHPKRCLKEACIVIYFLLRKLSISMSFSTVLRQVYPDVELKFLRLCHTSNVPFDVSGADAGDYWLSFVVALLMLLHVGESKSSTLKLLSLLCTLKPQDAGCDVVSIMNRAIKIYGSANESCLEDVAHDVLPSILTTIEQFYSFLPKPGPLPLTTASAVQVFLAQLKFGKSKGYVQDQDLPVLVNNLLFPMSGHHSTDTNDFSVFKLLLSNKSAAIRQSTSELITFSTSTKAPISPYILSCLLDSLAFLHDETDAFYRGELFSTFRRFLTRLCQSCSVLSKNEVVSGATGELDAVDNFLALYVTFLKAETSPHLPYGRHILSLDLLNYVFEIFKHSPPPRLKAVLNDSQLYGALFRLGLDAYEDVRLAAVNALLLASFPDRTPENPKAFDDAITKNQPLLEASRLAARTNRSDHADALGRILSLLLTVQKKQHNQDSSPLFSEDLKSIAQSTFDYLESVDHFDVSAKYPLHGYILGVTYSIRIFHLDFNPSEASQLRAILLKLCQRVWTLSQSHLCVDSPEVETDSDEVVQSGPKDLLAYAWRALRDSNLMLQAMLNTLTTTGALVEAIGDLCFDQLTRLRHRGAFSTVAQTFVLCCSRARGSGKPTMQTLIDRWFERALSELDQQADRLTRRSAGLPALFSALHDPENREQFWCSFNMLVEIAAREPLGTKFTSSHERPRLPQVHALNCIKEIMTNSRFRIMTEPLVVLVLNLAAESMTSSIWAIKNCGLMLLRASINRLDPDTGLGLSEAGLRDQDTTVANSRPFDIAVTLLTEVPETPDLVSEANPLALAKTAKLATNNEAEFAGLDLLGRLFIKTSELNKATALVMAKLGHRLWHVRAQAARLLASMIPHGEELAVFEEMVRGCVRIESNNNSHGRLLVAQNLLRWMRDNIDPREYFDKVFETLVQPAASSPILSKPLLVGTWLELINLVLAVRKQDASGERPKILAALAETLTYIAHKRQETLAIYDRAYAMLLLQMCLREEPDCTDNLVTALRYNDDAAFDVFRQIQDNRETLTCGRVLDCLVRVMPDVEADDVRAQCMDTISSSLLITTEHPGKILSMLVPQFEFHRPIGRNVMISQVKLYAVICKLSWQDENHERLAQLREYGASFCLHLRNMANDGLDDITRFGAAEALSTWKDSHGLADMLSYMFGVAGSLEVMSVLYDLLNDDDDEVRSTVSELSAHLCNESDLEVGFVETFCAAASRQKLHLHILKTFMQERAFSLECFRRLLGLKMNVSPPRLEATIMNHCEYQTAEKQLKYFVAAAKDLFAEEKQNLYLDDLVEIKLWAKMAVKAEFEMPQAFQNSVRRWVNEGITTLCECVMRWKDMELNYSSDFEILLVRVVTMARVGGGFTQSLEKLARDCTHINLPDSVITAFTDSLV